MNLDNPIIKPGTMTKHGVVVNSGMYQTDEDFANNEITVYIDTLPLGTDVLPYEESEDAVKNKVVILDMKAFEEANKDDKIIKITLGR